MRIDFHLMLFLWVGEERGRDDTCTAECTLFLHNEWNRLIRLI